MEKPVDNFEKGLRFGCGSLFGLVFGAIALLRWSFASQLSTFLVLLAIGVFGSGYLAMRYGDRYWEEVCKFYRDWI